MNNNEINHSSPFKLRAVYLFYIVAVIICVWFSGCTHVQTLPDGYKVLCNQSGKYSVASDSWQSVNEYDTRQEAIEWADYWNSIKTIKADEWSECEENDELN